MPKAPKFQPGERIPSTRLRYLHEAPKITKRRRAAFECDCGNTIETDLNWVRFLNITSCGCFKTEVVTEKNAKHSHATRENKSGAYRSYTAMHQRVKVDPNYTHVSVCSRWSGEDGFINFLTDMGDRPNDYSIERKDGNNDYEPSNCIWADVFTQAQNTSNAVQVTINGVTHTINEWCRRYGIGYYVIKQRRRRGMTLEAAITTPLDASKQGRKRAV